LAELRLHTLGGLVLAVDGEATTGAATQRRRLALLALLAAHRHPGLARDRIVALLWPESTAERARHGLNQLLYAQRNARGGAEIFQGNKTLRLNPEVIVADLWEFEDALARGAHREAVELYLGPFLDGFFLRGAPEFERWVEGERRRLAGRCAEGLRALAAAATAGGDPAAAAGWWRRAADLDPYDGETALHLVETLIAAGDRAGAVRHADQHGALLRADLGVVPDPRLARLIEPLRQDGAR